MTAQMTASVDESIGRGRIARILVAILSAYRNVISPLRPPACRYTPSCSAYAVEAITVHGAARGTWLALRRVLRCHPFHRGGHDPVPTRVDRHASMLSATGRAV